MVLSRGQVCRPLVSRTILHNLVRTMTRDGLSYKQIQNSIFENTGAHLSKGSISYWVRGIHKPSGSLNSFRAKPTPELCYVVGVALSDGNLNVHEYHREVLLSVTDKDFADEFSRCLGVILGRAKPYSVRWREKRRRWVVQGASVLFHQFLGSSWSNVKKWLEHCERCGFAFLRAFYDGEGSISGRTLTVSNTNRELLQYIRERLRRAGIVTTSLRLCTKAGTLLKDPTTGRIYVRKKDCFQFSVRAQSLSKFSQLIGFTIARKQARLYDALSGARGKSCKTSNHSP